MVDVPEGGDDSVGETRFASSGRNATVIGASPRGGRSLHLAGDRVGEQSVTGDLN